MRIDAHQHFWRYDPEAYAWIKTGILARDYLPSDLRSQLNNAGIGGTVAVQARSSWSETTWLLELASRNSWIVGVVGWADLTAPDLRARIASWETIPSLVGIRCGIEPDVADPNQPSAAFLDGIAALAEADLAFDLLIRPPQLALAQNVAAAAPGQRFVLDHLAKPLIKTHELEPWASDIRKLAALPNVACKVSGMVTEADREAWQASDLVPYLDVVLDAFGPDRLMFGSDWPVCRQAAGYGAVLDVVRTYIARLSPTERSAILGETAMRWYGIGKSLKS